MQFKDVKCNVCGSGESFAMGKRKSPDDDPRLETNIVRCVSCGLIYPNPMPGLMEADIQQNFDRPDEYFARTTSGRLKLFEDTLRRIEKAKPGRGRILDVGCGRGEFLALAGKSGWCVVGTDISKSFVEYAKTRLGVNAIAGDLEDIELPAKSFDAICLISVIQYLQDPVKTLKRIRLLLKDDGVLYIETTNEDALIFRAGDIFQSFRYKEKVTTHLSPLFPSFQMYGFNKRSVSRALDEAGLRVCGFKIEGIFGGGDVKGSGLARLLVNLMRKAVILAGGSIGMGHLLYCIAKKKEGS